MTQNSKQHQPASLDNVKPLLADRAKLYVLKKEVEARIDKLDEELRPMLVGRGETISDGFSFNVTSVPGRTTYDTKRMIADGMDLDDYTKVGAPSSRFVIKPVNAI